MASPAKNDTDVISAMSYFDAPEDLGNEILYLEVAVNNETKSRELARSYRESELINLSRDSTGAYRSSRFFSYRWVPLPVVHQVVGDCSLEIS